MTRMLTTTAAALLLTGGFAFAQTAQSPLEQKGISSETTSARDEGGRGLPSQDMSRYDTDQDQMISRDEYDEGMLGMGIFEQWDEDDDDMIDQDEWRAADWDSDMAVGDTFEAWDEDDDGMLDEEEFQTGMYEAHDMDASGDWSDEEYGTFAEELQAGEDATREGAEVTQ